MVDRTFGELRERSPEWHETSIGSADAAVTITRTGSTSGERHYLMDLVVGYDKASVALCRVCDGSTDTPIYEFFAHDSFHVEWHDGPLRTTAGNDLIVRVAAGSAGALASLSVSGFTA